MKNTIKMNRTNEIKAKELAEAAKAKAERLNNIKPKNIVETLAALENEAAKVLRNEKDEAIGIYTGKYVHKLVNGVMVAAETAEDLVKIEARMAKGINGDQLLHKVITLNGHKVECVGQNEEEINASVEAAETYCQEHPVHFIRDLDLAEQLKEAGLKAKDLEQVTVEKVDYIIIYPESSVMDLTGCTVTDKNGKKVNLSDIKDKLSRATVKILLLERLNAAIQSKKPEKVKVVEKVVTKEVMVERPATSSNAKMTRACSITLCPRLRDMTVEEIIRLVLGNQTYKKGDKWGYKDVIYIDGVEEHLSCSYTIGTHCRTILEPTVTFIIERIAWNSPVEANSENELIEKVARIVYEAFRDEPYFGMTTSDGSKLAKMIAVEIVSHSTISYR